MNWNDLPFPLRGLIVCVAMFLIGMGLQGLALQAFTIVGAVGMLVCGVVTFVTFLINDED